MKLSLLICDFFTIISLHGAHTGRCCGVIARNSRTSQARNLRIPSYPRVYVDRSPRETRVRALHSQIWPRTSARAITMVGNCDGLLRARGGRGPRSFLSSSLVLSPLPARFSMTIRTNWTAQFERIATASFGRLLPRRDAISPPPRYYQPSDSISLHYLESDQTRSCRSEDRKSALGASLRRTNERTLRTHSVTRRCAHNRPGLTFYVRS